MKIALIGASGYVGSALLQEALQRGHHVTALVSRPERIEAQANLTAVKTDVQDSAALAAQLQGFDAVLSAFSGHAQAEQFDYFVKGIRSIVVAAKAAKAPRLLVVGGAGSLEVAPGVQLVDTPEFPEQWKASALGAREALNLLRAETELNWTLLSPSAMLQPGERTGKFRLGKDQLLVDDAGNSHISVQDYAVAMIDELEKAEHQRSRFTVGY
ncbi:3-beta hydroxysteroid dehydrogenase [Chromobacterium sphagni]|uniref:3-beta hydroxysteroid dehydrogenase n=1 Tax=Chromobacterium sphagni TaxID=1903179 RepID=A0A1S1WZJ8_9NEIS|nr:NAD(P)-dependent oxidoreductase [Chromobacterium sphagni]OHX12585.1 3-beta hydroxysteroid dehydrogenase [Chromobacterium sphagni]